MTSRKRVISALSFREPDKIPIDFGGHRSSGISAIAYARLKEKLGITAGGIYVHDMIQQLAVIEEPVLERFQVDTIELGMAFTRDESCWKDWILPDGTPCKIPALVNVEKRGDSWYLLSEAGKPLGVQRPGMDFFDQIHYPMEAKDFNTEDFSDLEEQLKSVMWNAVPGPESSGGGYTGMSEEARAFRNDTARAVVGLFGGNLFETPQTLFRNDNYLLYTILYPEAVLRLSEVLCDKYCMELEKWLAAFGPSIDIILFGDDFGSNQGPLIDPGFYRLYYKPFHKRMWALVKKLAPHVKILLHSCGSIEPFLDDLIEAGLDAINPVQISAANMSLEALKEKYEGRITFWGGGCDTQSILPNASKDEIEEHVRKQVLTMKGSGGFVFQQVHNIMSNVPPESIIQMFDTAIKYR